MGVYSANVTISAFLCFIFYVFVDFKLFVLMIWPLLAVFLLAKLMQASNYIINSVSEKKKKIF